MQTLKFLFGYTRNQRLPLIITVLSMFCLTAVQLVEPKIISEMIAIVKAPFVDGFSYVPSSQLVGKLALIGTNDPSQLTIPGVIGRLAIIALTFYLFRAVFTFLRSYAAHVAGWGAVADARRDIYRHLQRLSLRFYEDQKTGDLMSRMVNDSDMFETLIAHAIPDTIVNILLFFGVAAILLGYSAKLMLVDPGADSTDRLPRGVSRSTSGLPSEPSEVNWVISHSTTTFLGIRRSRPSHERTLRPSASGPHISRYRDSRCCRSGCLMATFHPLSVSSSSLGTIILITGGSWCCNSGFRSRTWWLSSYTSTSSTSPSDR